MAATDLTTTESRGLDRPLGTSSVGSRPSIHRILRRVAWWEWMLLIAFLLVCLGVAGRVLAHPGSGPTALNVSKGFAVCMVVEAGRACTRARKTPAR